MKVTLTNGEIFIAREPLMKLMEQKFPIRTSFGLAQLAAKLAEPLKALDDVKNGLIKTYGDGMRIEPEITKEDGSVEPNPQYAKFAEEFNELLALEVTVDFNKVILPEKIASTCDKCHHNMDKELEVEAVILLALEKFVGIA